MQYAHNQVKGDSEMTYTEDMHGKLRILSPTKQTAFDYLFAASMMRKMGWRMQAKYLSKGSILDWSVMTQALYFVEKVLII